MAPATPPSRAHFLSITVTVDNTYVVPCVRTRARPRPPTRARARCARPHAARRPPPLRRLPAPNSIKSQNHRPRPPPPRSRLGRTAPATVVMGPRSCARAPALCAALPRDPGRPFMVVLSLDVFTSLQRALCEVVRSSHECARGPRSVSLASSGVRGYRVRASGCYLPPSQTPSAGTCATLGCMQHRARRSPTVQAAIRPRGSLPTPPQPEPLNQPQAQGRYRRGGPDGASFDRLPRA